jgi:hypothetical protein
LGDFRIAGSTSAFTIVIAIAIECHTDWISDYVARLGAHDLETIEATEEDRDPIRDVRFTSKPVKLIEF